MSKKEKQEYRKNFLKKNRETLLNKFKRKNNNLKQCIPDGNLIKHITLINDYADIKEVFFYIDLSTIAFGFIPSIIRKRYKTAIILFIIQALNFGFIAFPVSIITNFLVMVIASIFIARGYIDYLIEKKRFSPHNIWKKINEEEERDIRCEIFEKKKNFELIIIICSIFIALSSTIALGYKFRNFYVNRDENLSIKNYMIVLASNKEDKKSIDSLLILNSKGNTTLNGVVYPGEIQVSYNNEVDNLYKIASIDSIDDLKKIISSNFNINIGNYIIIDESEIKNIKNSYVENYENILMNILKLNSIEFEKEANNILKKYPDIDKELLNSFYNTYSNHYLDINEVNYKTVLLKDIVKKEIIKSLDIADKENYKFITTDVKILKNNTIIKDINKKYEKYLKNKKNEEKEDLEKNEEIEEDIYTPPVSNNEYEEIVTPPVYEYEEDKTPPSNNNEQSTTPPIKDENDVKPPTNSEGNNGGSVKPPTDSGENNDEGTKPPTNSEENNGESVKPPTDNGENNDEGTKPPTNSEENNSGGATPPINNEDGTPPDNDGEEDSNEDTITVPNNNEQVN